MEQKKSTLKEIKLQLCRKQQRPANADGGNRINQSGEVIDRLTLQMCPDDLGFAVCFAQDQVFFSISSLPEEEQEEALTKNHYIFGRACASRSSKGLRASSHFQACREIKRNIRSTSRTCRKRIRKRY
mgnify:CR=1 FL=1